MPPKKFTLFPNFPKFPNYSQIFAIIMADNFQDFFIILNGNSLSMKSNFVYYKIS